MLLRTADFERLSPFCTQAGKPQPRLALCRDTLGLHLDRAPPQDVDRGSLVSQAPARRQVLRRSNLVSAGKGRGGAEIVRDSCHEVCLYSVPLAPVLCEELPMLGPIDVIRELLVWRILPEFPAVSVSSAKSAPARVPWNPVEGNQHFDPHSGSPM